MPDYSAQRPAIPVVTRPPHYPTAHTRDTVVHCVAFGLDDAQIAVILRCTVNDVKTHYAEDLEHGLTRINARVQAAVLHQALFKEDVAAMKFWLINKAGWRAGDSNRPQIPGLPGDGDAEMTVVQRHETITRILTQRTLEKRNGEKVIDGRVLAKQQGGSVGAAAPVIKPSVNGTAGVSASNGNGIAHSNGTGGINGVKHR